MERAVGGRVGVGRGDRLVQRAVLGEYLSGHAGVSFRTPEDAADDFRRRFPFEGTERPADMR